MAPGHMGAVQIVALVSLEASGMSEWSLWSGHTRPESRSGCGSALCPAWLTGGGLEWGAGRMQWQASPGPEVIRLGSREVTMEGKVECEVVRPLGKRGGRSSSQNILEKIRKLLLSFIERDVPHWAKELTPKVQSLQGGLPLPLMLCAHSVPVPVSLVLRTWSAGPLAACQVGSAQPAGPAIDEAVRGATGLFGSFYPPGTCCQWHSGGDLWLLPLAGPVCSEPITFAVSRAAVALGLGFAFSTVL